MAKVARKVHKETAALAPLRSRLPALPHLAERIEEIFREPMMPFWPQLKWTEPLWPQLKWPELLAETPTMDLYEEGAEIVVKAELPGMKREEIEVTVAGDVLTISGKKEREEKVERKDYHRFERSAGAFRRSVRLPAEVMAEKVTARLENGVLEVRAPKSEAAKSAVHKIAVV